MQCLGCLRGLPAYKTRAERRKYASSRTIFFSLVPFLVPSVTSTYVVLGTRVLVRYQDTAGELGGRPSFLLTRGHGMIC